MQKISKFEVTRLLGKGTQSSVYLANDPILQREVAVKVLQLNKRYGTQLSALLSEARTSSKLHHRNVLPIYEAGEYEGQIYLVFEYIEGRTLDRVIRDDGAIASPRAAELMIKILDGVAHAHEMGIIHRDLKPSNILIDKDGEPHVMDFGIATPISQSSETEPDFVGTPAYMSPEYIAQRIVTPQYDVFSAGLMLYEMVVGERAVKAQDAFQAMHQISNVPLVFPERAAERMDAGLHEIIARATVKETELRFKTVQQMRDTLDQYLHPKVGEQFSSQEGNPQSTLDFLLRRMKVKTDFPAMSAAISTIQRMASAERGDVNKLSNAILTDFALTNKILRLVNSSYYPVRASGGINTVSRAIVMLGFDAVSSIATSLILFEHLKDKKHSDSLKEEFLGANMSAIVSTELSAKLRLADVEEIYICTVFHNLGRLLAQYYFREEAEMIQKIVSKDHCSEDAAAVRVLGISYQDLGIGIAKSWGFPESIVNSMRRLPTGKVAKPHTADDRLRLLSAFSCELSAAFGKHDTGDRSEAIKKIMQRFGDCVPLTEKDLTVVLEQSTKGLTDLAATLRIDLRKTRIGARILQSSTAQDATKLTETGPVPALIADNKVTAQNAALVLGAPANSTLPPDSGGQSDGVAILAAGIQDISQALVEDMALSDLLRIIAETIFRAIDVKRVLICTRDGRTSRMCARFGYGDHVEEVVNKFQFALNGTDLFNTILGKDADVLIHDSRVDKIRRHLPEWYRKHFDAPAFIIFPISIKGTPVAMIYADHDEANAIKVSEKELSLLRTLRNQAVMAIKQAR